MNYTQEQKRDFKIIEVDGGVKKKVNLVLVGLDGNAFVLLGKFQAAAKREGWSKSEIDYVLNKATSGDYSKLLSTLIDHSNDPSGVESGEIVYVNGQAYKKL